MTTKNKPVSAFGATIAHDAFEPGDPRGLIGRVVADRYEIQELLGSGGMGSVYRACHIHIKKQVAVKTLHPAMLRSPEAVARFEREAVAAARISHPNVVVATDFGPLADGRYYLVLEYVVGRDLRQEIDERGALGAERSVAIARQIAAALEAAHGHGIVHRDLKPENVMLTQPHAQVDQVKVLDFGIAKMTLEDSAEPLTQLGAIFGTPQYMSPEQAKGQPVDGRSDLYALGLILYEMLTGKLPFEAADPLGYIMQQLNAVPPPLPNSIPEPVRQLVHRLLEKAPDQRPASASVVLAELQKFVLETPVKREALPRTSVVRPFANSSARIQRLIAILREPFHVGKRSFPRWLLLLSGVCTVALPLLCSRSPSAPHATESATAASGAPTLANSSALPMLSKEEFDREIARIDLIKPYLRKESDWMLLARGSAKLGQWEQCAAAYRSILALRRDLRKDPVLLSDLLAASEDAKAFRVVLNLAESVLGRHGVDLLWEIWQKERFLPDRKEQADKVSKKLVILTRRASPALRIAIELTFTTSCDKLLPVVARAVSDADSRSIERLMELTKTTGCGAEGNDDCFPCLRDGTQLEQAVATAKKTQAQGLGSTVDD